MRENFEKEICHCKELFVEMGKKTQEVIKLALLSLEEKDTAKAKEAIVLDDGVDKLEYEIENKCLSLIALQQPIAKDLRTLGTLMKIITDMERIGDYGVNIAKVTLGIKNEVIQVPFAKIHTMNLIIEDMINKSMESFLKEDIQLAKHVAEMDDEVDDLFTEIIDDIIVFIMNNPTVSKEATNLMFVARHLERIADHTTNICERIIYMVTGVLEEIN